MSSSTPYYQIKVKGILDPQWSAYFGELEITTNGGNTTMRGPVVDQAALHGILMRIRDLGLPLLLAECLDEQEIN